MKEMIAYCGINCNECPAFLATMNDDDDMRKMVAEAWSKDFNTVIKPEDINCDGCLAKDGRIVSFFRNCKIRKCAPERGLISCAFCDDYPCEKLKYIIDRVPEAKARLEKIRSAD
jgi:hypothetical protein